MTSEARRATWGEPATIPGAASEAGSAVLELRRSIAADVSFHTQSRYREVTVVAPVFRAVFPLGRWTLELDVPILVDSVGPVANLGGYDPGHSGVQLGNLTAVMKHHWLLANTDLYVGPGVALPLSQAEPTEYAKRRALTAAVGTRGAWNIWWYTPQALSIFVPIGFRHVTPRGLDVGVEAAFASLLHAGSGTRDTRAGAQLGGHLGYASPAVEAGARVRAVRLPGERGDDHGQISMAAYARAMFGSAHAGGGLLINLDEPLGPLLDRGSTWGLLLEGGTRF